MRYIEVVGSVTAWSLQLTLWDRCMIGKFTRENVEMWLANHVGLDPGFYPEDFHAVCGDIEIPWATKEGSDMFQLHRVKSPTERETMREPLFTSPKERVYFNQLPEQIRRHKHCQGLHIFGEIWFNETQAVVQSYPGGDQGEMHTDCWEKTADGRALIRSYEGDKDNAIH